MAKYNFYYDESEHSRKINYKTISAYNYYDNFVTMIVGWDDKRTDVLEKYEAFENRYSDRKDRNGEIKSTMLQQKQFKYGFASINKQNVNLIRDFLSIFDEDIHIYFSVSSKIEYLVIQLFQRYKNSFLVDTDFMKYSIIKALVMYRPKEVMQCIDESPQEFLEKLKTFFRKRIDSNKSNSQLKIRETEAFQQILFILDDISDDLKIDWDYHMSFDGFRKYLAEKNISRYYLMIDKEGKKDEKSKTLKAAHEIGLDHSSEGDSKEYPGLRIADMMAGIIAKLLKGLCDALRYQSPEESTKKKILNAGWFCLNENQLELYKKLYLIICKWQPAWYKFYSGIYSDDLVVLNALLNFMNHFESVKQIQADIDMQGEYFNHFACEQLENYFEQKRCKLPIEPVLISDKGTYLNQRGEEVYIDSRKQSILPLHKGSQIYDVLSVGVDQNFVPTVTIKEGRDTKCFRLPQELSGWACSVIGMAAMGSNVFPAKIKISNFNGEYDIDIL